MSDASPILIFEYPIRSRYAETDQMGYVYHGRYLEYFETTRTEFIRKAGITYKSLEDSGIMMPVMNASLEFIRPVFYDEVVTVRLIIYELPTVRLKTHYEIIGSDGTLRVRGDVMLCFIDSKTRRPCRPPEVFTQGIKSFIGHG